MYVDILILAELASRPYHGYELKRHVEQILGDTLTINANQLYPALRRFEEMGAVTREVERQEGKPDRHIYHLTDRGLQVLHELLREFPPDLAHSENEFGTRVTFFHLLDPQARLAILNTRQAALRQRLHHLEQARLQLKESSAQFFYVTRFLAFQQQHIQQELDWIVTLLQEMH